MKDDRLIAIEKLEEARKNYEMGRYNNTVAYCNQALQFVRFGSDKDITKEIFYLLGLAHLELGTSYTEWDLNDSILACKYFDKVIAMDSNYVEAYLNRGLAIVKWGNNYKLAIADFDKVLELELDNELARKCREFCYEQLSKEEESEIDD
jgi:tetratricopeptide (TPR) repeat protein